MDIQHKLRPPKKGSCLQELPTSSIKEIQNFSRIFPERSAQVCVLTTKDSMVYLIGTNRQNKNSQIDVVKILDQIKPDSIFIELCELRACSCSKHLNNIFQKPQKFNFRYLREIISDVGILPGFIYFADLYKDKHSLNTVENLWLECNEEIAEYISNVSQFYNCKIVLGDRPVNVTLRREAALLNICQKTKLISLVTLGLLLRPIKKPLILKASKIIRRNRKTRDTLILERDLLMTNILQTLARKSNTEKLRIVAIVSEGHFNGVQNYWGRVTPEIVESLKSTES